jgi:hypothetical protein
VELTNVVIRGEDVDNDAIEWRINGTLTLKSAQLSAKKIVIEAGDALSISTSVRLYCCYCHFFADQSFFA